MEDRNGALQEPLLQSQLDSSIHQTHTFTFTNGDTRSVSRRDETISCTPEWILGEVRKQVFIAGPMVCVALLQYLLIVISVMFVGHLGELELASASIATSSAGVTGTSLIIGMAAALETLCGQAYGAKQYHMLGIYMQRAIFVLYLVCIPIAVVWWNMDSVLVFLGQDPQISELAGVYARYLIPTIFAVATLQPLVKFLQTQSLVLSMALFSAATLILHIPLCWLLIFKLGIGYRGAAIAGSLSNWLNVIFVASYVKYSATCKGTWTSFSREAFNDLPAFIKLAIPSAIMICLEYWSFQGLVLLSGLLPNPQLETSTLSICLTCTALLYMIPFGIGAAVSTRVGNELGAGRPQAAKGAAVIAVSIGVSEGLVMATILYFGRNLWGKAFTQEQEVIEYVARSIPLLAIMHIMDATQGVLSGVARGCGWQAFGAAANLGAYYVVGLPAAVVLAFVYDLKGRGLWVGLILGVTTAALTLLFMACATNWQQQAEEALLRVYSSATATLPIEANHAQKDEIPALRLFEDGDCEDRS
ncbi:hypothetical protein KC19_6G056800 [Ceratodon purpureus]|uniref:Protein DETOXIFICATION n=1 Tax=Ceratodon purpureus TaxID=3225 RepID=A0A8T0HDI1_CERPU|nr:hypothetical protein KC19_6G056800 [Ceratodon purpureus]